MKAVKSSKKSNLLKKNQEIRRANDLRVRIETYCKQEHLTRPDFAELLKCSKSQLSSFMTGIIYCHYCYQNNKYYTCMLGSALTGSEVYSSGMKYLKTRMPLSNCSESDRNNITNDKWKVSFGLID